MSDLSLLPHDPVRFFGLAEGYDRRDLKRAYGQAIRVYKPETHAAEFGRVRDAYERLEQMLRYGKQQQQHSDTADAWRIESKRPPSETASIETTNGSTTAASSANFPPNPTTRPRGNQDAGPVSLRTLALLDPASAVRRFETMSRRTPPDYYVAAILADATQGRPTAKYLGVLLDGVAAHPSDPGLLNLTLEYLRSEVPDEMAAKIVRFVAEKLRSPSFYMLTEPLWLRLIQQLPFEQWKDLLGSCERVVRQTEPANRTVFYLRLLRSAIWIAPPQWVDRVMNEIESESAGLPFVASSELEFLSHVQQLLRDEASFVSTQPTRQKLLHAIRLSCQREDSAATAEVLKLFAEVARDANGVKTAFPMASAVPDAAWVMLVYSLVEQYEVMLDKTDEFAHSGMMVQLRYLVHDLKAHLEAINSAFNAADWNYRIWPLAVWIIVGTPVLALPVIVLPFVVFGHQGAVATVLALIGIVGMFVILFMTYFRYVYPKFLLHRLHEKRGTGSTRAYEKWWRARLFRFVSATNEPVQIVLSQIEIQGRSEGQPALGNTVAHFIHQDSGLCIFAALRSLLR